MVQADILEVQAEDISGDITTGELKTILDKYFDNVPEDLTKDVELTAKDEYGKHKIKLSDLYKGRLSGGIEVGSIIKYEPSGTYKWEAEYCSAGIRITDDVELNSSTNDYKISTWRILEIDRSNNKVTLVPIAPTVGTVFLESAQGYNNAVYLLNEACKRLYGDAERGIEARSINMEDIEGKMTEEALAEAHSYAEDEVKYGEQSEEPYAPTGMLVGGYPSIYAKETLSVIDGNKIENGLGRSEQTNLIKRTDDGADIGILKIQGSIQAYQTLWEGNPTFMSSAFKNAENGINYYDLIMPKDTRYWVATRGIYIYYTSPIFCVYSVYNSRISYGLSYTFGHDTIDFPLFPIVSVDADLISGNEIDGFSIE